MKIRFRKRKSGFIPSSPGVKLGRHLRNEITAVLRPGETLAQFVESAVWAELDRRRIAALKRVAQI